MIMPWGKQIGCVVCWMCVLLQLAVVPTKDGEL